MLREGDEEESEVVEESVDRDKLLIELMINHMPTTKPRGQKEDTWLRIADVLNLKRANSVKSHYKRLLISYQTRESGRKTTGGAQARSLLDELIAELVEKEASELELSATQSAAANAKVSFIN
jgi:hypothetical protein